MIARETLLATRKQIAAIELRLVTRNPERAGGVLRQNIDAIAIKGSVLGQKNARRLRKVADTRTPYQIAHLNMYGAQHRWGKGANKYIQA